MTYKLEYYVPKDHLERVNQALFAAGAGKLGNYDQCCWTTEGQGQFRPLEGADPFQGSVGVVERTAEVKVEMLVEDEHREAVRSALLAAHPYETPAFHWLRIEM